MTKRNEKMSFKTVGEKQQICRGGKLRGNYIQGIVDNIEATGRFGLKGICESILLPNVWNARLVKVLVCLNMTHTCFFRLETPSGRNWQ